MVSPDEGDRLHAVDITENDGLTDTPQSKSSNSTPLVENVDWQAEGHDENDDEVEVSLRKGKFSKFLEQKRILEKGIFVISIATIAALTHGLLTAHWLVLYYYAVSAPVLIGIRCVMYWKLKYQYFLLDFCYFGNWFCYIFVWVFPHNNTAFVVLFGLTNGPLAWAIIFFRNSMVFHSTDKMTSLYIHTLPAFVTYSIRWYPQGAARYWYTTFAQDFNLDIQYLCLWLLAVPIAVYASHGVLYMLVVDGILKPSEEYLNSFRYLRDQENIFGKLINICGPRFTWISYYSFYWTYCLLTLLFTILWFKYHWAHSIFILIQCILATWNGASYYIDVFSVRGFKENI